MLHRGVRFRGAPPATAYGTERDFHARFKPTSMCANPNQYPPTARSLWSWAWPILRGFLFAQFFLLFCWFFRFLFPIIIVSDVFLPNFQKSPEFEILQI
jgi:hypothetical protein